MRRRYTTQQREHLIETVLTLGEPVKAVGERISSLWAWAKKPSFVALPRS